MAKKKPAKDGAYSHRYNGDDDSSNSSSGPDGTQFGGQQSSSSTVPQVVDPFSIPGNTQILFEAPAPRDYAQETEDTLATQIALAPDLFRSEARFRPMYAGLDYRIYDRFLPQYLQTQQDAAPIQAETAALLRGSERSSDIADVMSLGPDALTALKNANPEAAALLDEMTSQAMAGVQDGMKLSADEQRMVEQNTRASYADRGMALSNPSIFAEIMNLDSYGRQRQNERRGFAGDVLGYQKSFYDPFQSILGRSSSNIGFAQGGVQLPQASQVGPQIFNPESAYAGNLYGQNYAGALTGAQTQAGLDQDYFNTMYNAQSAANIAAANNAAAMNAAQYSMAGSLGGSLIGAGGMLGAAAIMCWIARAAYGANNPKWMMFRRWLLTKAPEWFQAWYLRYGPEIGAKLAGDVAGRKAVREWMDKILKNESEVAYAL